jgi:glycine/D-amino acid oxidase-like deaminating enzyme
MQALHGRAKALGVRFHQNVKVSRVLVTANHAGGVELGDGTAMAADAVVLAAGARARALGEGANAPLPLAPKGRHLVLLECDPPPIRLDRVVWRIDDEVYFRAESGGVLASPCDELEHSASLEVQQQSLVMLAEKLRRTAPSLRHARVRHAWVGLRTFAPDRAMVIGADPRVGGLFWLAGLGGHGISAGVAASELVARAIVVGEAPPEPLLPNRLLAGLERSSRGEGG